MGDESNLKSRLDELNSEFLRLLDAPDDELQPPVDDPTLKLALAYIVSLAAEARLVYIHIRTLTDQHEPQVGASAFIPTGGMSGITSEVRPDAETAPDPAP